MNLSEVGVARTLAERAKELGAQDYTGPDTEYDLAAFDFETACDPEWVIDTLDKLEEAVALLEQLNDPYDNDRTLGAHLDAFLAAWRTPETPQ